MLALLFAAALGMTAPRVVEVRVGPVQREILKTTDRFTDVEGALRSSKTWTILIKIRRQLEDYPGIRWAMSRWNEGDLHQKLIPDWRNVCALMSIPHGTWNTGESCYDFPNGSRIYAVHLKSSQKEARYAKVRGLTVAGFYIDQLEELDGADIYEEAALRLSQPGYPQQMIVSPNPIPDTHWIAKRFPTDNRFKDHRYIRMSIWDNRHNLDPQTIQAAETLYPEGHPQRRTKLEGKRGLDVRGTPVYTGAFSRTKHVKSLELMPDLPLCEAYDYGFHHPCVLFYQYAPWGWVRVLGGVMGADMHLDAFLPVADRFRNLWFPSRLRLDSTCDPAGANENAQGLRGTPVGLLREWYQQHGERDAHGDFVVPRYLSDANQPERRHAANELAATYMRHRVNGDEAFLVDGERWVLAALNDERFDNFFIDGLEVGYVLEDEARHSSRLGTFWVPKKDGWFEHPQNCFEYGIQAHVLDLPLNGERAATAVLKHGQQKIRQDLVALRKAQMDRDPDDLPRMRGRIGGIGGPRRNRRGGY